VVVAEVTHAVLLARLGTRRREGIDGVDAVVVS
jgi:hypothetical protein